MDGTAQHGCHYYWVFHVKCRPVKQNFNLGCFTPLKKCLYKDITTVYSLIQVVVSLHKEKEKH